MVSLGVFLMLTALLSAFYLNSCHFYVTRFHYSDDENKMLISVFFTQ